MAARAKIEKKNTFKRHLLFGQWLISKWFHRNVPLILVAGKGRRGMFLFLLFLHFHSCSSFFPVLSFISSAISSISFLPFSGRRHKMIHKGWRVVKPQHNQILLSPFTKIAKMVLLCWTKWSPELKVEKPLNNTSGQWLDFKIIPHKYSSYAPLPKLLKWFFSAEQNGCQS